MTSPALALIREKRKSDREARSWAAATALLTDPVVLGVTTALGGILLCQRIRWHEDDDSNANLKALATATCVLAGVARCGLNGWAAAGLGAAAGVASDAETSSNLSGQNGFANFLFGSDRKLFGIPIPFVS